MLNLSVWPLAVVAGYAAAAIANIAMFHLCGPDTCSSASWWSSVPSWVAIATGCWFIRHRASRTTAALAGVGVALAIAVSNAPMWAQTPLSFSTNRFPGDFIVGLLFVPLSALMLVLRPLTLLFIWPLVAGGALFAAIVRSGRPASSRLPWARAGAAAVMLAAALLVEKFTTPTVWDLGVHRRIVSFDLRAPAGTMPNAYRSWSRKQLNFSLSPTSTADAALAYYDRTFEGWRPLDRTADDGIWVDPTGTVLAWVHCSKEIAHVSLSDFDRAAWQQRSRRTASGDRIVDLARDVR